MQVKCFVPPKNVFLVVLYLSKSAQYKVLLKLESPISEEYFPMEMYTRICHSHERRINNVNHYIQP